MTKRIGIINYGAGNLLSVKNAFEKINCKTLLINSSFCDKSFDILVLPGVGSFGEVMNNLHTQKLFSCINNFFYLKKPIIGICLGMHLMFEESEESEGEKGFGWLKGKVKKLRSTKMPNVGWNIIRKKKNQKFKKFFLNRFFYFDHNYFIHEKSMYTLAKSNYIASLVQKNNLIGTQFQPEKSGDDGLKFLEFIVKEF